MSFNGWLKINESEDVIRNAFERFFAKLGEAINDESLGAQIEVAQLGLLISFNDDYKDDIRIFNRRIDADFITEIEVNVKLKSFTDDENTLINLGIIELDSLVERIEVRAEARVELEYAPYPVESNIVYSNSFTIEPSIQEIAPNGFNGEPDIEYFLDLIEEIEADRSIGKEVDARVEEIEKAIDEYRSPW